MCSIIGYCGKPADMTAFQAGFAKTISRGPDDSRVIDVGQGILGFTDSPSWGFTRKVCSPSV